MTDTTDLTPVMGDPGPSGRFGDFGGLFRLGGAQIQLGQRLELLLVDHHDVGDEVSPRLADGPVALVPGRCYQVAQGALDADVAAFASCRSEETGIDQRILQLRHDRILASHFHEQVLEGVVVGERAVLGSDPRQIRAYLIGEPRSRSGYIALQ